MSEGDCRKAESLLLAQRLKLLCVWRQTSPCLVVSANVNAIQLVTLVLGAEAVVLTDGYPLVGSSSFALVRIITSTD